MEEKSPLSLGIEGVFEPENDVVKAHYVKTEAGAENQFIRKSRVEVPLFVVRIVSDVSQVTIRF